MLRLGTAVVLLLLSGSVWAQEEEQVPLPQAKARFEKADRALREATAVMSKSVVPELAKELARVQRDWLTARLDTAAYDAGFSKKASATGSAEYYLIAAAMTEKRAEFFQRIAKQKDTTMTGVWGNGWGTVLRTVDQDNRLFFQFDEPHVARLSGVAAWNDRIGWFSDRDSPHWRHREANICFIWHGWKLQIVSANTLQYFDRKTPIDNTYYKIGSLTDEESVALVKAAEANDYEAY